jgi:hypothetical protein
MYIVFIKNTFSAILVFSSMEKVAREKGATECVFESSGHSNEHAEKLALVLRQHASFMGFPLGGGSQCIDLINTVHLKETNFC